jgi:ribonuclease BN (tRNA processing enzyme)
MLWTERTRVLIDCGIQPKVRCEELLEEHAGNPADIKAVVVSHVHHDHICYSSLRVLAKHGISVRCHESSIEALRKLHARSIPEDSLRIRTFSDKLFRVGEFLFRPIPIPHRPESSNFGFVIHCRQRGLRRKVVIMTDFYDWKGLLSYFIDADFIFVESNHDVGLLKRFPNYNSRFHMKNEKTAWLLYHARKQSRCGPQAVMLGHISARRNSRELVLETFRTVFRKNGIGQDFELLVAERDEASPILKIRE